MRQEHRETCIDESKGSKLELVASSFILVSKSFSSLSDRYGLEFDFILNDSEEWKASSQGEQQGRKPKATRRHKTLNVKSRQLDNGVPTNQSFFFPT
jgi:hypothetical protein